MKANARIFVVCVSADTTIINTHTTYHEKELLLKLAEGDEQAYTRIYCHFQQRLLRFILPFSIDRTEAEEIVQDALFKIWTRRETLAGINSLEHYLQRIARNILIDRRRAKALQQKYYGRLTGTDRIEAQAEEDYLLKQYHLIARDAINRLSDRQREIFLLRHSGDLSLAEIATQTRSTIPAVQKNLTRAVQFIKTCLLNNKDWTTLWIISVHFFF